MSEKQSIYQEMKALRVPIGSHESDLHVAVTPETRAVVERYEFKASVTTFRLDGVTWFDIPFAFDPWWEIRQVTGKGSIREQIAGQRGGAR